MHYGPCLCVSVRACVHACEKVCVYVPYHDNWLKGGVVVGGPIAKKVHHFQMDLLEAPLHSAESFFITGDGLPRPYT